MTQGCGGHNTQDFNFTEPLGTKTVLWMLEASFPGQIKWPGKEATLYLELMSYI